MFYQLQMSWSRTIGVGQRIDVERVSQRRACCFSNLGLGGIVDRGLAENSLDVVFLDEPNLGLDLLRCPFVLGIERPQIVLGEPQVLGQVAESPSHVTKTGPVSSEALSLDSSANCRSCSRYCSARSEKYSASSGARSLRAASMLSTYVKDWSAEIHP